MLADLLLSPQFGNRSDCDGIVLDIHDQVDSVRPFGVKFSHQLSTGFTVPVDLAANIVIRFAVFKGRFNLRQQRFDQVKFPGDATIFG